MVKRIKKSWKTHKKKWGACDRCDLCAVRKKIVLGKGTLPCDILFIGEAPGASEDVLGRPFVGPAGQLLTEMITEATGDGIVPKMFFTNLVGCIPKDGGGKAKEPPKASIKACADRVADVVELAKPKAVVAVGRLAAKYGPDQITKEVVHPAAILRANVAQRGLAIQRVVAQLREVIDGVTDAE